MPDWASFNENPLSLGREAQDSLELRLKSQDHPTADGISFCSAQVWNKDFQSPAGGTSQAPVLSAGNCSQPGRWLWMIPCIVENWKVLGCSVHGREYLHDLMDGAVGTMEMVITAGRPGLLCLFAALIRTIWCWFQCGFSRGNGSILHGDYKGRCRGL